jgi:hypothetical protein
VLAVKHATMAVYSLDATDHDEIYTALKGFVKEEDRRPLLPAKEPLASKRQTGLCLTAQLDTAEQIFGKTYTFTGGLLLTDTWMKGVGLSSTRLEAPLPVGQAGGFCVDGLSKVTLGAPGASAACL